MPRVDNGLYVSVVRCLGIKLRRVRYQYPTVNTWPQHAQVTAPFNHQNRSEVVVTISKSEVFLEAFSRTVQESSTF